LDALLGWLSFLWYPLVPVIYFALERLYREEPAKRWARKLRRS